ncbi:TPA: septum formation protein Maf [Candidatus Latescibacteria bacterium]|nr:septum formation protein Maf [Candidatus Latescibacterota bacterium]
MSQSLILASASPRRADLLRMIGVRFEVFPSDLDETTDPEWSPEKTVAELASMKAVHVGAGHPDRIGIGADTVVVADDRILGKPKDPEDARATLRMLSGRTHQVMTAVHLIWTEEELVASAVETTDVTFRDLSDDDIDRYLATSEPYDKAGAYGIQGQAALFTEGIRGCFYNVVGFPIVRFWALLNEITDGHADDYRDGTTSPDLLALGE